MYVNVRQQSVLAIDVVCVCVSVFDCYGLKCTWCQTTSWLSYFNFVCFTSFFFPSSYFWVCGRFLFSFFTLVFFLGFLVFFVFNWIRHFTKCYISYGTVKIVFPQTFFLRENSFICFSRFFFLSLSLWICSTTQQT